MKSQAENAAEQAAFWNGPGGKMWLAAYDRIQHRITHFSEAALAAAKPQSGEKVLDVGCGTGATTAELARAVGPEGHVLGVDISAPLIGAAREHKLGNASFALGDAATHPFETASVDLVFSRFGVMFFGDPVAAFRHLHAGARQLAFVCWRPFAENPWAFAPFLLAVAAAYLGAVELVKRRFFRAIEAG